MKAPLRVLVIASHPLDRAPGQRFRFEQWLRLLPPGTAEFDLRPLFPAGVYERLYQPGQVSRKVLDTLAGAARRIGDLARAKRYDVVFLYREALPLGPPIVESLMASRVPLVFDFDDAIFIGDTSPANKMVARLKFPQRVDQIIRHAAVTTVGNPWLADYARRHSSSVEVVPTTIDLDDYRFVERPVAERMTIGWSGSRTTPARSS